MQPLRQLSLWLLFLYYPISGQTKQENFLLKRFEKGCKEIGIIIGEIPSDVYDMKFCN